MSLIKREIKGRYHGSLGGIFWSLLTPLLMLLVYTLVFGVIFKSRFIIDGNLEANFSLSIFIALITFTVFAECLSRSPTLITSHVNYVKKVVFPLELLPFIPLGASCFNALVSLCVWIGFYIFLLGLPSLTIFLLPVLLMPLIFLSLGTLWLFSSLGLYLRDIGQVISLLTTALMFLSAIFYPLSSIPEPYQVIIVLNPLALLIDQIRSLLIFGMVPNLMAFGTLFCVSFGYAWLGFFCFQRLRKGFIDVI